MPARYSQGTSWVSSRRLRQAWDRGGPTTRSRLARLLRVCSPRWHSFRRPFAFTRFARLNPTPPLSLLPLSLSPSLPPSLPHCNTAILGDSGGRPTPSIRRSRPLCPPLRLVDNTNTKSGRPLSCARRPLRVLCVIGEAIGASGTLVPYDIVI